MRRAAASHPHDSPTPYVYKKTYRWRDYETYSKNARKYYRRVPDRCRTGVPRSPQRAPLASSTTGNAIVKALGDAPSFSRWEGRRRAGISAIGRKRTGRQRAPPKTGRDLAEFNHLGRQKCQCRRPCACRLSYRPRAQGLIPRDRKGLAIGSAWPAHTREIDAPTTRRKPVARSDHVPCCLRAVTHCAARYLSIAESGSRATRGPFPQFSGSPTRYHPPERLCRAGRRLPLRGASPRPGPRLRTYPARISCPRTQDSRRCLGWAVPAASHRLAGSADHGASCSRGPQSRKFGRSAAHWDAPCPRVLGRRVGSSAFVPFATPRCLPSIRSSSPAILARASRAARACRASPVTGESHRDCGIEWAFCCERDWAWEFRLP